MIGKVYRRLKSLYDRVRSTQYGKSVIAKSPLFNAAWYADKYTVSPSDAALHYFNIGWKLGHDPSPQFSTNRYLEHNPDIRSANMNPLVHFEKYGRREGRTYYHSGSAVFLSPEYEILSRSELFDKEWYAETYDLDADTDPVYHYLKIGSKKFNFPSKLFSGLAYCAYYRDVYKSGMDPLVHYETFGKFNNYNRVWDVPEITSQIPPKDATPMELAGMLQMCTRNMKSVYLLQDKRLKEEYNPKSKKLIVFVVPYRDCVGGGIMSICSIAKITCELEDIHGAKVIIATTPSQNTIADFTKFDNPFHIYRFDQLCRYFTEVNELLIHIPEVTLMDMTFFGKMDPYSLKWLQSIHKVTANILLQNWWYKPQIENIEFGRQIIPNWTMTIAHTAYCDRQLRSYYNMSVHFFSTSNLVKYKHGNYEDKEDLLLYSEDENAYKATVLESIKKNLPTLKTREIKNIPYAEYLDLISRAKWMITFGEGIDGYFLESARCGAIPFAVYNSAFFEVRFEGLENVYGSYADMIDNITDDIKAYDSNRAKYTELSQRLISIDKVVYNEDEYKQNIKDYYLGKFTYPFEETEQIRQYNIKEKPLISIAMATYNGEKFIKKQLQSINNLTYKNVEIIISDDGSTDRTLDIIRRFKFRCKRVTILENKGKHGVCANFSNAFKHVQGKYVAMCDQDDIWKPNKLEVLLENIEDYDLIHSGVEIIDDTDKHHPAVIMHTAYEIDKTFYYKIEHFAFVNEMLGCTSLIRTELIKPLLPMPEDFVFFDWGLVVAAILKGNGIRFINEVTVQYRQHETNTAKTFYQKPGFNEKLYKSNRFMAEYFKNELNKTQRNTLKRAGNWFKLYHVFETAMPNLSFEYWHQNQYSQTDDFLLGLEKTVKELLNDSSGGNYERFN